MKSRQDANWKVIVEGGRLRLCYFSKETGKYTIEVDLKVHGQSVPLDLLYKTLRDYYDWDTV